ncbi:MAG: 2-amino-4-hydroxy-6-hydroxymethyldihydropteridine diphosphokinase [Pseudomonadota bacterium]
MTHTYLIALGSNMRVPGIGGPRRVLAAAVRAIDEAGLRVLAAAPPIDSAPIGPSLRRYANAAVVLETGLEPPDLLSALQALEERFGRSRAQRRGQRWMARALDLDIIAWSGGAWSSDALTIPHREMRGRNFVLSPALVITRDWRDPVTGLTLAHLYARLRKAKKKALNRTRG